MIRFGIVGAGNIARKFARDIVHSKDAVLTAVASRSLEKALDFKEEFKLEFAFGSYEEMAKSNEIDAVYIATPHNFHMEQSILFMNHKKHVLCEKPIAVNTKQFEKMVELSKQNNVLLMEAMWTRFLPSTLKVREIIKSNKLGKLKNAYMEFGISIDGKDSLEGRLLNPDLAGGSLLDVGIYPVSYTLNLTEAKLKKITTSASFHETGVDTECKIDMFFEDGSKVTCFSSFKEDRNTPAIFEFENGIIQVDQFWRSQKVTALEKEYTCPFKGEGFPHELDSFVETIKKGEIENHIMTHELSRKSMELLDKIRASIGLVYPFEQ